jgi:hypothetical protein
MCFLVCHMAIRQTNHMDLEVHLMYIRILQYPQVLLPLHLHKVTHNLGIYLYLILSWLLKVIINLNQFWFGSL